MAVCTLNFVCKSVKKKKKEASLRKKSISSKSTAALPVLPPSSLPLHDGECLCGRNGAAPPSLRATGNAITCNYIFTIICFIILILYCCFFPHCCKLSDTCFVLGAVSWSEGPLSRNPSSPKDAPCVNLVTLAQESPRVKVRVNRAGCISRHGCKTRYNTGCHWNPILPVCVFGAMSIYSQDNWRAEWRAFEPPMGHLSDYWGLGKMAPMAWHGSMSLSLIRLVCLGGVRQNRHPTPATAAVLRRAVSGTCGHLVQGWPNFFHVPGAQGGNL